MESYGLARAILEGTDGALGGFERDVSDELFERGPQQVLGGVRVPLGALVPRGDQLRQLQVSSGGAAAVFDDPRGFRRALRQRSVLGRLGATHLDNLRGSGVVVVIGTGTAAEWITETALIATGLTVQEPTLRRVRLDLKIAGGLVPVSRELLTVASENPDVEDLVRQDLLDATLAALDRGALVGTGSDGQPLGAFLDPAVPVVEFGGASSLAKLAEMEETAVEGQADPDERAWIVTPSVRRQWRVTPTAAGSGRMLMDQRRALGYPVEATAALTPADPTPAGRVGFGAWPELVLATFGAVDLVMDPFSRARERMVEVALFLYASVGLLEPTALVVANDVVVV
jgi:HK97 family phage major capsid protein